MVAVVKIGTSSLTDDRGRISTVAIDKLCSEIAVVRAAGTAVVLVTSAAIAAGLPALGFDGARPKDTVTLQAAAAVGQSRLLGLYDASLAKHGLVGGQILVSASNFFERRSYLHLRETMDRLLQLGIVPIVNENDAVTDDEIRFGDNDHIAALVAHAVKADQLVLLTDTAGLFSADPRIDASATLISEVTQVDEQMLATAGGAGTARGSGGMASKLSAARMASWSGVNATIAAASKDNVLPAALAGQDVGTRFLARDKRMSARKVWIAFALPAVGRIAVDAGARRALVEDGRSLLAAGVTSVSSAFKADSSVEIVDAGGAVFAKGLSRVDAEAIGNKDVVVVHRDDLVLL